VARTGQSRRRGIERASLLSWRGSPDRRRGRPGRGPHPCATSDSPALGTIRIATVISQLTPPRHRLRPRLLAAPLAAGAAAALLVSGALSGPVRAAGWAPAGGLPDLGSGEIWQVVFAPDNPSLAAAATDDGVYVSSDGGNTWSAAGLHGSRVWAVAFEAVPGTGETLYAGLANAGIRVSTDDGTTWSDDSTGLPNLDVRDIAVTAGGLAAGTDDGVALSANGTTWFQGGLSGDSISAVAGVPGSSGPVFFAGVDYPSTGGAFLYRRDPASGDWAAISSGLPSNDVVSSISIGPATRALTAGASATASPSGTARPSVTTSPSVTTNPNLVTTAKGTYRSGNGGVAWTASNGIPQNTFLTDAAFSPLDPNLVYAGADAGGSSGGGLFRSTDGGQSFAAASQGLPTDHSPGEPARQEVESIAVAPGRPYATVIAALDPDQGSAGIYREVDTTAPSPPALSTASGSSATLPATAATLPPPTTTPAAKPKSSPTPSASLIARVTGTAFHFPTPLVFELAFVLLAVFLYIRWRRHYYVDGPP